MGRSVPFGDSTPRAQRWARWRVFDTFAEPARRLLDRRRRRAMAVEQLHRARAQFRTFVDFATDALLIHDERGTIVDANKQACDALGYSREELIGRTPCDFDVQMTAERLDELRQRLRAGEILTLETQHRRKDGTLFPVEVRARGFWQGDDWMAIALSDRKSVV